MSQSHGHRDRLFGRFARCSQNNEVIDVSPALSQNARVNRGNLNPI